MSEKVFYDQMSNRIRIRKPVKRIVSIVPSQTELLHYLGLNEAVVGITKFCVHPEEWHRSKVRVGGTKKLDMEKIARLNPDLIIGNKEENTREQVEELMQNYPVWMSDIHNLNDTLEMIAGVGAVLGKEKQANRLITQIKGNFGLLQACTGAQKRAAYFIWQNPYMTVGKETFIHDMMNRCGFENVFAGMPGRYPVVAPAQIIMARPELILLPSEPYPFAQKHIAGFRELCPHSQIMLVDGEYFSWYGSRIAEAPKYLNKIIREVEQAAI